MLRRSDVASNGDAPRAPRVAVVIPNWNGLAHLPECFAALATQTFTGFVVYFVDNASKDGSVMWIAEHAVSTVVLQMEKNGGFSYAVNAGVAASDTEYVALLNNDTVVDRDWLRALVDALDAYPEFSIAASRMVFYSEPSKINAAGDLYSLRVGVGYNRGFGEPVDVYESPERVLGACAGAALYRRSVFDSVGPFDESFFLGAEDTDFNIRALIAGEKAMYVPTAIVRHKLGASRNANPSWRLERIELRNNGIVIGRDLPLGSTAVWILLSPWRLLRDTFPIRPSKWRGLGSRMRRVWRGYVATIEGVFAGLPNRGSVWGRRRVPVREIRHWLKRGVGPL